MKGRISRGHVEPWTWRPKQEGSPEREHSFLLGARVSSSVDRHLGTQEALPGTRTGADYLLWISSSAWSWSWLDSKSSSGSDFFWDWCLALRFWNQILSEENKMRELSMFMSSQPHHCLSSRVYMWFLLDQSSGLLLIPVTSAEVLGQGLAFSNSTVWSQQDCNNLLS